jgi:hypothetical protein
MAESLLKAWQAPPLIINSGIVPALGKFGVDSLS